MSRPLHLPPTAGLETLDAKQELRAAIRAHRNARSAKARQAAAEHFARHGMEAIGDARCVACYVSTGAEPGSGLLLEAMRAAGIRVLLPKLGPGLERSWGEFRGIEELKVRAPGRPPEPAGPVLQPEEIARAEAIIAPALAVDAEGTRLGQGGGWYDRALLHRDPDAPVFAMIHEAELLADIRLPRAEHDVLVDAVITEERWFLLAGSPFQVEARRALAEGSDSAR